MEATGKYMPTRRLGEPMQVIAVANFKGGSGKTTTAAHLAQYLALHGYRVLAVDLDPQASLSALHGYQPEFDIGRERDPLGALRYDEDPSPARRCDPAHLFPRARSYPRHYIELMEYEHETPRAMLAGRRAKASSSPHRRGASDR